MHTAAHPGPAGRWRPTRAAKEQMREGSAATISAASSGALTLIVAGERCLEGRYNMDKMLSRLLTGMLVLLPALWADVRGCQCDPAKPETMEARECGLCREAEKQ